MPEEVLVSAETGDDAAVYRLPGGRALVVTVDFFTPIVDDPYDWGRIGAANSFSDVYAMGGTPVLALNLVGWPVERLPLDMLARVLEGGSAVAAQAGLYLTKPLGSGILSTAIKQERASEDQVAQVVEVMVRLNADAAAAMVEARAEAATDVTGFGLLGHLRTMLAASGVSATVQADAVPVLPGVLELAREGVVPGGTKRNHQFLGEFVTWGDLDRAEQLVLADAQTSGGLLIVALDEGSLADALHRHGIAVHRIGQTVPGLPGRIRVEGRLSGA
jgi:selenide, water dikinase